MKLLLCLIFYLLFISNVGAVVNADSDLNIAGRSMYVSIWHYCTSWSAPPNSQCLNYNFSTAYNNKIIANLTYINVDHVILQLGACAFYKTMKDDGYMIGGNSSYFSPTGGLTKSQIIAIIDSYHDANITVTLNLNPSYRRASGDGCTATYLGLYGNYLMKYMSNGGATAMTTDYTDLGYPDARSHYIDFIEYIITTYDFDGIHMEEINNPWAFSDLTTTTYFRESWRNMYLEEYNATSLSYTALSSNATLKKQVALQNARALTLFFKEMREMVDSLGDNYTYPYFTIDVLANAYKFDQNSWKGADSLGYGIDLYNWTVNRYVDRYFSESSRYFPPATMRSMMDTLANNTPGVYRGMIGYLRYSSYDVSPPDVFDVHILERTDHNMNFEIMFHYGHLNDTKIDNTNKTGSSTRFWCSDNYASRNSQPYLAWAYWTSSSNCFRQITYYQYLHSHPPELNRTFNPIGVVPSSVNTSPTISTHPTNVSKTVTENVTFTVTASGTTPLNYQWQLNGSNISGATSSSYTISYITNISFNGRKYRVLVSNSIGSIFSNNATLTVQNATSPMITKHPLSNVTLYAGSQLYLDVVANGTTPLSYQWYKNDTPITNATEVVYITSINITDNQSIYYVNVTNSVGSSISTNTTLTVFELPPNNLILNGGFEDDYSNWFFYTDTTEYTETISTDHSIEGIKHSVLNIGNNSNNTQLRQSNINLSSGKLYNLTFWAKSDSSQNVYISLRNIISPYQEYGLGEVVDLSNVWTFYDLDFTSTVTLSNVTFQLWFSTYIIEPEVYYFDDFKLYEFKQDVINSAPTITNIVNSTPGYDNVTISYTVDQLNVFSYARYSIYSNMSEYLVTDRGIGIYNQSVSLSNLNQYTTYYVSIYTFNGTNQSFYSNSSIINFTTKGNITNTYNISVTKNDIETIYNGSLNKYLDIEYDSSIDSIIDIVIWAYNSSGNGTLSSSVSYSFNISSNYSAINLKNTGWQAIFVNKTQNLSSLQTLYGGSNVLWIVTYDAINQGFEVFKGGESYRASDEVESGSAILLKITTNASTNISYYGSSYNWTIYRGWNLLGLDSSAKTLSEINTSINTNTICSANEIVFINRTTQIEYAFTCGNNDNDSILVNKFEGFWVNSTSNISKVRSW